VPFLISELDRGECNQLQAPADFLLKKRAPVSIGYRAEWARELVLILWK
jgi:hypothetical protein